MLIPKEEFRDGLVAAHFIAQLRRYTHYWAVAALLSGLFCWLTTLAIFLTLRPLELLWTLPSWLGHIAVVAIWAWMRCTDQADYGANWAIFYGDHGSYGRNQLRHVQRDSSRHKYRIQEFEDTYSAALAVPDEFPRDELMPALISDDAQHRWLENRLVIALDELNLHAPVRFEHRWDEQYSRFESIRIAPLISTNVIRTNVGPVEIVSPVDTPSQAQVRAQLRAEYDCFQQQTRFPQDGAARHLDRWLKEAYGLVGDHGGGHEPDPNEVVAEVTSLGTAENIVLTRADVNPQNEVSRLTLVEQTFQQVEQAFQQALRVLHEQELLAEHENRLRQARRQQAP